MNEKELEEAFNIRLTAVILPSKEEKEQIGLTKSWPDMIPSLPGETYTEYARRRAMMQEDLQIDHTMTCAEIQLIVGKSFNINWDQREKYRIIKAFAIPCKGAIDAIRRHQEGSTAPVIDPMAGTGYWAWALCQSGVPAIAFDKSAGRKSHYGQKRFPGAKVGKGKACDTIRANPDSNVLLSWPPYSSNDGTTAVDAMAPGRVLYYVGEGEGGCCGDDSMFESLKRDFDELEQVDIPQFYGLHDYMQIYRKK